MLRGDVAEPAGPVTEQEEADDLEHALPRPRVDVADVAELLDRSGLDPGLLGHLAQGRDLGPLARRDQPLRQGPDPVALPGWTDRRHDDAPAQAPYDHASRRELATHREFVT